MTLSMASTALLDRASIDGGVYALPVNNVIYGIYYNKTLMEEHGWELPANFAELEALCAEIKAAGLEPGYIGMQLTGVPFATVFNLAKTGFDAAGDGEAYPYVLVTCGGADLKDGETYRVAFTANSYTEEVGQACNVQVEEGTLSTFVRTWLEEQGTVSPDGNPWE